MNKKLLIAIVATSIIIASALMFWTQTKKATAPTNETQFKTTYNSCEERVKDYTGKSESDILQNLQQNNITYRIVAKDGESFPVTMDYQSERVNLELSKGVVTNATCG